MHVNPTGFVINSIIADNHARLSAYSSFGELFRLNTLLGITPGVMNNGVQIEINDFERYSMDIWQFTKLGEPVFLKNKGKQEMVILGVEEYAKLIKKTMD